MNEPTPQRYSFVLGTGRCGSTLVQELVARHPDVGFVTNVDDRLGVVSRRRHVDAYRRLPQRFTQKGRVRFAPSEAYRALAREVSPLMTDSFQDLAATDLTPWLSNRLEEFFDRRARLQQLPLFLHKFTGWPRARLLARQWPQARFVHIVRDGRAVANSWLQMPWWRGHLGPPRWHFGDLPPVLAQEWDASDRSQVVLAGLAWKLLLSSHDEAASAVGPQRWLEVRYEDVVADPQSSIGRIADFLGLPDSAVLEDAVSRTAFSRDRGDAFRDDLGPEHVASLDEVLAQPLHERGYL